MWKLVNAVILTCTLLATACAGAAAQNVPPVAAAPTDPFCTARSPAERAYCLARQLAWQSCRTGTTEERLDCLERRLARQAEEIAELWAIIVEFTTPGVKPLGQAAKR